MSNTRTLELDISKEGTGACVKVGQGDDGGTTIKRLSTTTALSSRFPALRHGSWCFCRTSATTIAASAR